MTRSLTTSDTSSVTTQAQQTRPVFEAGEEVAANETIAAVTLPRARRTSALKVPLASAWNEALCCEARNSLQVILSGTEILLEDHVENLLAGQKELLAKMSDNTYHLCNLLSTLLSPDEFILEETTDGSFRAVRRAAPKLQTDFLGSPRSNRSSRAKRRS